MAKLIDLIIDRGILLDIGIGRGNIGFRLIIIVIADEVPHIILGKESLELAGQLGCQRLVMGNDECRLLHLLDHLRNRIGLAGSRCAQQHLRFLSVPDACRQVSDCLRLIAHRLKRRHNLEWYFLIELHRIELRHHSHNNFLLN